MAAPHWFVDKALDGLAGSVQGGINDIGAKLEEPLNSVGVPTPGPHKVPVRLIGGGIQGLQSVGQGLSGALSVPWEALLEKSPNMFRGRGRSLFG